VAGIDLAVQPGEMVVILGPSGCGKTTLLRIMGGLLRPSRGVVSVVGRALWNGSERHRAAIDELGIVFQEGHLFPWATVEDNIALPLRLRGVARRERREQARELCRLVGIQGFERRLPRHLSGGMRQRAAIARTLAGDPRILLMDEPLASLDALTREQMSLEIQRIWLASSCTAVMVTHSITEAVFLADRIVVLTPRPGRVDTITEVDFPRPRDFDVQATPEFQTTVQSLRERLVLTA